MNELMILVIGFLAGLATFALVAFLLSYTVKFDGMELDDDD